VSVLGNSDDRREQQQHPVEPQVAEPEEVVDGTEPAVASYASDAHVDTTDTDASTDELIGAPVGPYSIGDPGRAAREVISTMPLNPVDPADTQLDGGTAGDLIVRAASSRGIAHRHDRTPRQDDYAICATDRWLVVAVADGVSAGSLSHQAATLACRVAAAAVRDDLQAAGAPAAVRWDEMLSSVARRIVAHGRRVLTTDEREAENITAKDVAGIMATTLAIATIGIEPAQQGNYRGAVVALGDTSAFLLDNGSGWAPVTAVKNEGATIASSATLALPYIPTAGVSPIPIEISGGSALMLMSDGVGDPLGSGDGPVGRHLAGLWAEPPDPLTFAAQVSFARKSFDDDRTVVGIWSPR
jgi:hypothetical protein